MSIRCIHVLVGAILVTCATPRAVACATCFGASDSKMAQGMNMGILVLLGVVGMVLGGLTLGFVALAVRSNRVAQTRLGEDTQLDPEAERAPSS